MEVKHRPKTFKKILREQSFENLFKLDLFWKTKSSNLSIT